MELPLSQRADQALVACGLASSRAEAQAAIKAGLACADGVTITKPAAMISADAVLTMARPHPWVSRAGVKLCGALDHFSIDVRGCVCLDLGASTGGFVDVLLARGARSVRAVDVGHGQLHPRLRSDPRVMVAERTDARALDPAVVASADLITSDLRFIGLI